MMRTRMYRLPKNRKSSEKFSWTSTGPYSRGRESSTDRLLPRCKVKVKKWRRKRWRL